jgi:hypothetical protein
MVTYVDGLRGCPIPGSQGTYRQEPTLPSSSSANTSIGNTVPDLRDKYQRQPPVLNVRQAWPADPTPKLTANPDLDLTPENWRTELGHISGTGRLVGQENTSEWMSHAWNVRAALARLHGGECINNASLAALLRVIGQGLEDTVYMMTSFISLPDSTPGQF